MMRKFSGNRCSRRGGRGASVLRAVLAGVAFTLALPLSVASASEIRVSLTGKITTTGVSGVAGTPVVLGTPEGTQGVYGIRSLERDDKPCYVASVTEEVNNYGKDSGFGKNLCGKNPGGAEMQVKFGDIKFARRTFVRAVRVCMTKNDSKVKGIQLRGRQFGRDGRLSDLPPRYAEQPSSAALEDLLDLNAPSDLRLNCSVWKEWVECPPGEIAMALVAHFDSGPSPNNLMGIALQCRAIGRER